MIKKCILIALLAVIILPISVRANMAETGKGAEEVVGSEKDWSVYAITVKQYFMLRNLVRDAYIEVQTWKALVATWKEQKEWFERNKQRWDRITKTLGSLSSNPKDMFSNIKKIESVTKEIDYFFMVETQKMDDVMKSYEDNISVAWDVVGPYLGNRYVPADQIWKEFNKWCQDHTMRNNPDWKKNVKLSGDDPGYVDPIYKLPEWKRRNILGKSYAVITSQADAIAMRRMEREKYWARFQVEIQTALAAQEKDGGVKADVVQGVDVMRRVQTLADVNDLCLSRIAETQALMSLAGEEIYHVSGSVQDVISGVNEQKYLRALMQTQLAAAAGTK